ncbi:acyl-CoA dehydrogenase [soil metagenome]
MLDFTLTDDQLALQKAARDFARNEIAPIAAARDRLPDPNGTGCWDVMRQAAALGFTKMMRPEAFGGLGLGLHEWLIVMEEFAVADVGFAMAFTLVDIVPQMILAAGTEAQHERLLPSILQDDLHVGAIAFSEPDRAGSDMMAPDRSVTPGFSTIAVRDGDDYVINGQKTSWVTNCGPETQSFILICATDGAPPQDLSFFYLPRDTPGLTIGAQIGKIGCRLADHASLTLDNVRVPAGNLLGPEGAAIDAMIPGMVASNLGVGAVALGLTRAAYTYALDYARTRMSWGRPIIEHQAVATMLADMHIEMEQVRSLMLNAIWSCGQPSSGVDPLRKAAMVKVASSEMAVRVTRQAMNVLGAYGLSKEYPVEKWYRDSLSLPIEDVHNIIWRLRIATQL